MELELAFILQLFALLNPLSAFPVLLAASKNKLDVREIAVKSSLVAFVIAIAVIFFGQALFSLYGISIDSFKVAGGVILFLLGIETVRSGSEEKPITEVDSYIAIIATPLLTGPAVISFLTIKTIEMGSTDSVLLNTTVCFIAVGALFYLSSLVIKKIDARLVEIVSKILGLFLTAIAIEMMAGGFAGLMAKAASGA
ncbi:MAG: MarC family protein [Candidatus Micrarchaeia archaeon]